jgi:arylformamidase
VRIYDISLPISEALPVWPGDPPIRITQVSHLERGDEATLTHVDMGAHTGTHVDAPAHFVAHGLTVDALDLGTLVGPAQVVHALEADALSANVLRELDIQPGSVRILFRTRNSERWAQGEVGFHQEFVAITEDGAAWLAAHGVRLVGIDYLSVASFVEPAATHRRLLRAGVIALEGLNLSDVGAGEYLLICLPLRIVGAEGAPARAILIDPVPQGFGLS